MGLLDRLLPRKRRRSATPASRPAAHIVPAPAEDHPALKPVCSRCGRPLESRQPPPGSMLRPLYAAVVCQMCLWVECKACKGSPSDAPCPVCGSPVMPAQVAFFESAVDSYGGDSV